MSSASPRATLRGVFWGGGEGGARALARGAKLGRKPKLTRHRRREAARRRERGAGDHSQLQRQSQHNLEIYEPKMPVLRVSDKLVLIDKVGRELQSRFRFDEIDTFLAEYKIPRPPSGVGSNSKWVYSKALQGVDTDTLLRIADELGVEQPRGSVTPSRAPKNWQDTKGFRLFISHIAAHKDKATRLKTCLAPYGIIGFVAHEDIHPTLEWQIEIERALRTMDAFIAIHTLGFSKSFWTQQEIGFAVACGVKIISFKMGEDPTGFLSKQQALARRQRTAEEIAREIDNLLAGDELTAAKLLAAKKALGLIAEAPPDLDEEIPF
jgi:hypothetical protein